MRVFNNIEIDIEIEDRARRDPELFLKRWFEINQCDTFEAQWMGNLFTARHAEKRRDIFPDELLERYFPLVPPKEGSFIGYKKATATVVTRCEISDDEFEHFCELVPVIVTLKIPEDAKRSSSVTRKCRCSHAKVLHIEPCDECQVFPDEEYVAAYSSYVYPTIYFAVRYQVGKTVYADKWDGDRWNECSHGIHFFMTRKEAELY